MRRCCCTPCCWPFPACAHGFLSELVPRTEPRGARAGETGTFAVPARVAQTAEQLTRNEQVRSSILLSGSAKLLVRGISTLVPDRVTPAVQTICKRPSGSGSCHGVPAGALRCRRLSALARA